jgi:glycerophosphoryl diester phosphodiesterase
MLELPQDRPLVVARRGARAHAPENTLPAFELAIAQGADAIEMDVQYTSDGGLITMQGIDVDEISDGTGRIRSHQLGEIKELDVGSWFSPEFAGTRVPTLNEVLDALAGRVKLVLELKTFSRKSEGMEDEVCEQVQRRGLVNDVTVTSFNLFALRRLKKLAPDLRTGLMQGTGFSPWFSGGMARRWSRADDWHPEFEFVSDAMVAKVQQPLWLWPVNNSEELEKALAWNAAAHITDDPVWLREQLAAAE